MPTTQIIDDKSPICIPFILGRLAAYRASQRSRHEHGPDRPFIIGLNGVQGVGKTTLVKALASTLREQEGLETLVCSVDDFYLTHADQVALAQTHPDNKLVQVRGEPSTHDMALARSFFDALCRGDRARIPRYDKSAFAGRGDRVAVSEWTEINNGDDGFLGDRDDKKGKGKKVQVVIFEGWCVGFRPLSPAEVEEKWNAPSRTLRQHSLEHLLFVNERLGDYDAITDLFDAFVHLDAEDIEWVYDWRLEQEVMLRQERGTGMTDQQVVKFVDAYYPAYELFSDKLRSGLFADKEGCQLRLVVGNDRKVKQKIVI